jgi:hypothetical protein
MLFVAVNASPGPPTWIPSPHLHDENHTEIPVCFEKELRSKLVQLCFTQ